MIAERVVGPAHSVVRCRWTVDAEAAAVVGAGLDHYSNMVQVNTVVMDTWTGTAAAAVVVVAAAAAVGGDGGG